MDKLKELKKLKELLDEGIIDEEDFKSKKTQILGLSSNGAKIESIEMENKDKVETETKSKSLDDYEKELLKQLEEETITKSNENNYQQEKLKVTDKSGAEEEVRSKRRTEQKAIIDIVVNKIKRVFKWIVAVYLWLVAFGLFIISEESGFAYFIMSLLLIALGCMACPKITDKTQKYETYTMHKTVIVWIVVIVMAIIINVFIANDTNIENNNDSSSGINETDKQNNIFPEIVDSELRKDFLNALNQIEMDTEKIKDFKQIDDWVGGTRYSFTYLNTGFRLYCNMDSTVASIKLGADTDIYKQGYEPYKVSNYIVNLSVASQIRNLAESRVKSELNYPSTADFSWLDWSYARENDIYTVSSTVSAKNAFGVESQVPFTLAYFVNGENATLIYFMINGNEILNNLSSYKLPERKEIQSHNSNDNKENGEIIELEYNKIGTHGKKIIIDGNEYINFFVPEGTYTITNKTKWCTVYLAKDEYYKNSSGYSENEIVKTIQFSNFEETATITISKGEHLELTLNGKVSLNPIK